MTDCKYLGEIHQRIKKAFDFPDFYGENWSAFMDLLWTECDANRIIVLGEHTVPKELEPSVKMINEILQELKDFRAEFNDFIEIEIYS
nr:barstar family protein [Clostridium sp. D33t1_170424_F3]